MKNLLRICALLLAGQALALGQNGVSGSLTVQNAAGNTGACTASSCSVVQLQGGTTGTVFTPLWSTQNSVSINLSGTFSATVTFQASYDEGATWNNTPCSPAITSATQLVPLPVISATGTGNWNCEVGGATTFRAVASTYSSGTVAVALERYAAINQGSFGTLPMLADSQQRLVSGAASGTSYNASMLVALPAAAGSLATVESDGTNRLYLRRLTVCLDGSAVQATAAPRKLAIYPTTAQSDGGAAQTAVPVDAASGAFGGIVRRQPTGVINTIPLIGSVAEAQALDEFSLMVNTASTALSPAMCVDRKYDGTSGLQPIAVPGGGDAGVALADLSGGASPSGNYVITAQFSVEPK